MIANIIKYANLDPRLGYKLHKNHIEHGHFRWIEGAWCFRVSREHRWAKVGNPHFLPGQLQAWQQAEDCAVILWQCCGEACKTPEARALALDISKAGSGVSHGFCDECFALWEATMLAA